MAISRLDSSIRYQNPHLEINRRTYGWRVPSAIKREVKKAGSWNTVSTDAVLVSGAKLIDPIKSAPVVPVFLGRDIPLVAALFVLRLNAVIPLALLLYFFCCRLLPMIAGLTGPGLPGAVTKADPTFQTRHLIPEQACFQGFQLGGLLTTLPVTCLNRSGFAVTLADRF